MDKVYAPVSPRETPMRLLYFGNKGDPDSGNPNPPDRAFTKLGPCQGMRGQKAKPSAKEGK